MYVVKKLKTGANRSIESAESDLDDGPGKWHICAIGFSYIKRTPEIHKLRRKVVFANEIEGSMIIGTILYTWLKGELVGTDLFSNHYYRGKGARLGGREKRWVIYKGRMDASSVPAEWHSWLHHTTDAPLTDSAARLKPWQQEHTPNPTGTTDAYLPQGHVYKGGHRAAATGDYQAWSPDS